MEASEIFNVYCDESCHLEHAPTPVMAFGSMLCETSLVRESSEKIRGIKVKYGLKPNFEAKWSKISPARADFYLALTDWFFNDDRLNFYGLVIPNKRRLNHTAFRQIHDEWYYKMYFKMLRPIFDKSHHYRIYLDTKDTRGGFKTRMLHQVMAKNLHDFDHGCIERVQQVRSHEIELLQITDILIGALTYANRNLSDSTAKSAIVTRLRDRLGSNALTRTSVSNTRKFNVLVWREQQVVK